MVALLSAGSAQADQSWTSGTTTLTTASGLATDNDVIDNATLIVTNGGSLVASQLTVSTGNVSTLTLTGSGALTVNQLWVTNNTAAVTNSIFNFNGGTLITSNAVGSVAARIVRPLPFSINGNWTMNGGINTNGAAGAIPTGSNVTIGNNATVTVNSGAIYNNGGLTIAVAAGSTLNINGGVMTNINATSTAGFNVTGGNSSMTVTNNGKLFTSGGSTRTAIIGQISDNNRVFIGSGGLWNFGGIGLSIGVSSTSARYNTLTVDADGMVTNMGACSVGSSTSGGSGSLGNQVVITNGGQVFGNSGVGVGSTSGSNPATSNRVTVVGSTSLLNIGGGIVVGSSGGTGKSSYNSLLITNGATVVSKTLCTIGAGANANSNYVIVAGASSGTNAMWNLSVTNLNIGNNVASTGNWAKISTGGMITNGTIVLGGVNSALYFDGGTLAAGINGNLISTTSTAVNASCYIQNAGAVIDSGAYSVTNTVPLVQDPASTGGGLTKLGSGTLTLAASNTYTGNTVVANGVLRLSSPDCLNSNTTLYLYSGTKADLAFSGTNLIYSITIDGKPKSRGVYGPANLSDYLTGSGYIQTVWPSPSGTMIRFY
jgi:autotransporter-associated beta strand protein